MTVTSCHCTVRVTKLHAMEGSIQSPYDLHLFSPLKKVLKGHRPQGHIGAVIPIATHCSVSGEDPPVGARCVGGMPVGNVFNSPYFVESNPQIGLT
jgi:hypothetical protein